MAKIYINDKFIEDITGDINVKVVTENNKGNLSFSYNMVVEGDVNGNVNAGMNLECKDVTGKANAGLNLECENVGGNANAGMSLKCKSVGGKATAGMGVKIG